MVKRSVLLLFFTVCFSIITPMIAMEAEDPDYEEPLVFTRKQKRPAPQQSIGKEAEEILQGYHRRKLKKKALYYGSATAITLAALAAATYAGLKYWQSKKINEVLARYGKNLSMITPQQTLLMIAAYKKDRNALRKYGTTNVLDAQGNAWIVPAMTELYFKSSPTEDRIEQLRLKIIGTSMFAEKL